MKWYDQILNGLKTMFNLSPEASESEIHQAVTDANAGKMNEKKQGDDDEFFKKQGDDFNQKVAQFEAQVTDFQQKVKVLTEKVQALQTRIAQLEASPAAPPTGGETDDEGFKKTEPRFLAAAEARVAKQLSPGAKQLPKW